MRVLLVGGTGFIGSALLSRLITLGHVVTATMRGGSGMVRDAPGATWVTLDMRAMTESGAWLPYLDGIEAIINCAGVLQDNRRDSTEAAHHSGPQALFEACESAGIKRVIHFSAIGVDRETPTDFSRSKAEGDTALMSTQLEWVILRPSVVVGRAAFGGSALFRGLAALPVAPRFERAGKLQIVQLDNVVATVAFFLNPSAPSRVCLELAGPDRLGFNEIVAAYRRWLGWKPARPVSIPDWLMRAMYRLGDFAGWLGWRPPIRSTAEKEILRGAVGDNSEWTRLTKISPRSLQEALTAEPPGVQERWFAKLYFIKPIVLGVFALFWIATALMSLGPGWGIGVALMNEGGVTGIAAPMTVLAGGLADLAIGVGVAFRRTTKPALYAALCLSLSYVIIGSSLISRLWLDPLGPMLKVWPIMALNLVAMAIAEDR